MPRFTDTTDMETLSTGGSGGAPNFTFSGRRLDNLGSTRFTLATICVDVTGSLQDYAEALQKMLEVCIQSLRRQGSANSIMLRVVLFSTRFSDTQGIHEVHGFKPLPEVNDADYAKCISCGGGTPLFATICEMAETTRTYGQSLFDKDYDVNAIGIVITDGEDNCGPMGLKTVANTLAKLLGDEKIESFRPILVGIDHVPESDGSLGKYLKDVRDQAGFDQYVHIRDADVRTIGKMLGDWISQSISSQVSSLGTGGPSQAISLTI